MTDIQTRADLEKLMAQFYDKLLADASISYIFTDVAKIDLVTHLPKIVDFWEVVVLHSGQYQKNVLQIHLDLHAMTPLEPQHFNTWLGHLHQTVDELFVGENAENLKTRALSVATVMQLKMQKTG
ncbi:group III truncated hemoglobin [Flavobacterium caeni]|uniref:Hemoglobin n=1 Tax=Flavobacterium caeni TaxID=490189 RepID=A0A1G5F5J7_9FLAO|nr:group III truncated hemoglobin [Flavobacterium caeni]SCY34371.1 hemoglobin [Flavobacterium caeni]